MLAEQLLGLAVVSPTRIVLIVITGRTLVDIGGESFRSLSWLDMTTRRSHSAPRRKLSPGAQLVDGNDLTVAAA
jgi:hypothetical protein